MGEMVDLWCGIQAGVVNIATAFTVHHCICAHLQACRMVVTRSHCHRRYHTHKHGARQGHGRFKDVSSCSSVVVVAAAAAATINISSKYFINTYTISYYAGPLYVIRVLSVLGSAWGLPVLPHSVLWCPHIVYIGLSQAGSLEDRTLLHSVQKDCLLLTSVIRAFDATVS